MMMTACELGIPDPKSAYQVDIGYGDGSITKTEYARYIVEPGKVPIGGAALFDTVATGAGQFQNLGLPQSAQNILHITMRDEYRRGFPLTSLFDRQSPDDLRLLELQVPGAHSDGGGSYDVGGLGHMNLKLAYSFLERTGLPLGAFPTAFEPRPANLFVHDSRWSVDKLIDGSNPPGPRKIKFATPLRR